MISPGAFIAPGLQCVKKVVFDTLAEVKEVPKTSNSHSSAYMDTVEGELRSKAKCLAKQAAFTPSSDKNQRFLPPSPQGEGLYSASLL